MSKAQIKQQIKERGTARIVAMVNPERRTRRDLARLEKCFREAAYPAALGAGSADARPSVPAPRMMYLAKLGVIVGEVDREGWERLQGQSAALDSVGTAGPLRGITGIGSAADAAASPAVSWGIEKIGVPALWQKGLSGKGVLVAHLDTGIDGSHPALKDAIEEFAEFDAVGQIVAGAPVEDSALHGTHTAGTIAGRETGGRKIGLAPGCRLVSGAVIDGGEPEKRLLAGVDWAMKFPIKILNMSLGFEGYFKDYIPVLQRIRAHGVLPVFAAGNSGPGVSFSPANYPQAVSVGALTEDGAVDDSSCSQRFPGRKDPQVPDLVTPGIDIISANPATNPGALFRADSGTSMAAPHVSGLAALLWEAFPAATVDQVERAIYQSCARTDALPEDRAGRGLPDAAKALENLEALVTRRRARRASG